MRLTGKLTTAACLLAPLLGGTATEKWLASRDAIRPLKSGELSDTYRAKSTTDDVTVELLVKFRGSDRAKDPDNVWVRQNFKGP